MLNRYSIFGDSISTFEGITDTANAVYFNRADSNNTGVSDPAQTWWAQVIDREGGKLLKNASFSGSMVQGREFPAGRSIKRARQVLGDDGEAPDVIYVFIGINDYGWGTSEAQEAGGSEASPAKIAGREVDFAVPGKAPSDAAVRFENAYSEMLTNLHKIAPDAEIRCITIPAGRLVGTDHSTFCTQLRGVKFDEYNDAIRSAAKRRGARVIDIAALGYAYDSIDGTHPNAEGMRQISELIHAALNGENIDPKILPDRLREECRCFKDCGVNCKFARSTSEKWSCVCERDL